MSENALLAEDGCSHHRHRAHGPDPLAVHGEREEVTDRLRGVESQKGEDVIENP